MFISAAIHTQSVWKAEYTYITTKADEIENYNKVKVSQNLDVRFGMKSNTLHDHTN